MRGLYGLYDAGPLVESVQITAPHNYNRASREAVYDFFARRALGLAAGPKESGIPVFSDLLVGEVPEGALDYSGVFRQFRERVLAAPVSRERLRWALMAEWPERVESLVAADGWFVLTRTGRGDRVVGREIEGKGQGVLVVSPGGVGLAGSDPKVRALVAAGRRVVLLEPFKGRAEVGFYSTFQRTEAAERAQDILTALRLRIKVDLRLTSST